MFLMIICFHGKKLQKQNIILLYIVVGLRVDGVGICSRINGLQSGPLQELAMQSSQVLLSAHAESDNRNYAYLCQRWKDWSASFPEVSPIPADPFYVALFAIHTAQSSKSAATFKILLRQ